MIEVTFKAESMAGVFDAMREVSGYAEDSNQGCC